MIMKRQKKSGAMNLKRPVEDLHVANRTRFKSPRPLWWRHLTSKHWSISQPGHLIWWNTAPYIVTRVPVILY